MSRSFKIESVQRLSGEIIDFPCGRYQSETPASSAKKAFTKINTCIGSQNKLLSLKITMRETTRNSPKKSYRYKVSKVLDKTTVEFNGEIVEFNYSTKIKSI